MPIRFQHPPPRSAQTPSRSGPDLADPGSDRFHDRRKRAKARFWLDASSTGHRPPIRHARLRDALPAGLDRLIRIAVNLIGAAGAALFARASVLFYLHTHRLIGALFVVEQAWFVGAFLARRPQRAVSRRLTSWLMAFGGTFAGVLFRPDGAHPGWGVAAGFGLQLAGLVICIVSLVALGRSFGFVAADRGVKTRGLCVLPADPVRLRAAGHIAAQHRRVHGGDRLQHLPRRGGGAAALGFTSLPGLPRAGPLADDSIPVVARARKNSYPMTMPAGPACPQGRRPG